MMSRQKSGGIEKAAHRLLAAVRAVQELVRVSRPAPDDPEGFDDTLMSIALFGKRLEGALELSGEDRAGAVEASLAALATWGEALAEQIEATDFSPPDETDFEVTILELEAATETARTALGAPPETEGMPARAQAIAWEVLAERQRQIGHEGFDQRHDAGHGPGALSRAAACYAIGGTSACPPPGWPWDARWWKPGPRRRDLIKSAALLLAEIERMDRETEARDKAGGGS